MPDEMFTAFSVMLIIFSKLNKAVFIIQLVYEMVMCCYNAEKAAKHIFGPSSNANV